MTATELDPFDAHQQPFVRPQHTSTWDGGFIGPDVDLFVSDDDARHMDRRYEAWLERDAS